MDLKITGKNIFITGSTRGIGKAIAKNLMLEGARVIIHGRTRESVDATIEELSPYGTVYGYCADLSEGDEIQVLLDEVDKTGDVDVLINNAAIFESKSFYEVSDREWMNYLNINLLSAIRLSRHFLPGMLKRNQGRIINIASEAGVKPIPGMIHYSVTKTALIGLSRGMAELTKGSNVTINAVLPGPTWTDGAQEFIGRAAHAENVDIETMIERYFKNVEPTSLLQRFATADEVANVVVFLCSDLSSAINGSAQRVEGGIIRSI
jgi:NAD(P)-dependent dehydrogenase (short-subunit alcohol dehydrogenase family)